jgi:MerR family redox-sensitive transcriptional activator SoxR
MADSDGAITIGELARRAGVATSALRYYEDQGLIASTRSSAGQRRYSRQTLRRIAFIGAAQAVGLSLLEIRQTLSFLPDRRAPNQRDWARLAQGWRPIIEARIRALERLRDQLDSCIGCGCLSLKVCKLYNPDDMAARRGPGARYLAGDPRPGTAAPHGRGRRESAA